MKLLRSEYKSFLDDIEKNIKNKEDLKYVKERFSKFIDVMLEQVDNIANSKTDIILELQKKQKTMEIKIDKIQQILKNIESDIYEEDGFDFEIVCPYCNYQFIIDVDNDKTEITCPECKNEIELNWQDDIEECCCGCEEDDYNEDSHQCQKDNNGRCKGNCCEFDLENDNQENDEDM